MVCRSAGLPAENSRVERSQAPPSQVERDVACGGDVGVAGGGWPIYSQSDVSGWPILQSLLVCFREWLAPCVDLALCKNSPEIFSKLRLWFIASGNRNRSRVWFRGCKCRVEADIDIGGCAPQVSMCCVLLWWAIIFLSPLRVSTTIRYDDSVKIPSFLFDR